MLLLKNAYPADESRVFIFFDTSWVNSKSSSRRFVNSMVKRYFGDDAELISEDSNESNEMIYKISLPSILTDDSFEKFFKCLKKIFSSTEDFLPHFIDYNHHEVSEFEEDGKVKGK